MQEDLSRIIQKILTCLRNGAIVSGDDGYTCTYRQTCLERAYVYTSQDLVPALLALDMLPDDDQQLNNITDVSAVMQKHIITGHNLPG